MNTDPAATLFTSAVARALEKTLGDDLVGIYPFGSVAFGDYQPGVSDIDLLAVSAETLDAESKSAVLDAVRPVATGSAVAGLDLVIVSAATAAHPSFESSWELAYGTFADHDWEEEVSLRRGKDDDATHLLAAAILRETGARWSGPPPGAVFGAMDRGILLAACRTELAYWIREDLADSPRTAVLNACRAWRYAEEDVLGSKIDGGRWALDRGADPAVVELALAAQAGDSTAEVPAGPGMELLKRVDDLLGACVEG